MQKSQTPLSLRLRLTVNVSLYKIPIVLGYDAFLVHATVLPKLDHVLCIGKNLIGEKDKLFVLDISDENNYKLRECTMKMPEYRGIDIIWEEK